MTRETSSEHGNPSAWPHRAAVAMAAVTFPLIWVGGLVTTYDAGMAVPDWPTTYGYNMFLYPPQWWLSGPWDLLIEHGHRLLGSLSGLLAIVFVATVFRYDRRRWMRPLALAALALVILQGSLGGIRVLAADREIAKLHGCLGPAYFAFTAVLAVLTSKKIRQHAGGFSNARSNRSAAPDYRAIFRLGLITTIFAYLQLFLGASLRHIAVDASPASYRFLVIMHLAMASVVLIHVILLAIRVRKTARASLTDGKESDEPREAPILTRLSRFSFVLLALTITQILLGSGTWIVKFGWPAPFSQMPGLAGYQPVAQSMMQANVVTAHVALGSLILALVAGITVRALVQVPSAVPSSGSALAATEAAS